ncbi:glycine--tRNA ligase subunit beta [Oceanivirga miroungae]|uniref:Glycine--tRNA ligase beta subunit n=1 Tax=Oceanivirga miroungae TaxID=1130046 RepID=A0A6I8MCR7_9FUSO|nr:glycine--tRNA ligase subunit beta [Oceanivirga miroungae]VWL85230.1 glycyl-tRNA synthetase subunit beta [Oceanivirga miroungae]
MKLLFELGVEELPSRYIKKSEEALLNNVVEALEKNRVEVFNKKSFSTPRRLSFIIELSDVKKGLNEKKLGPSVSAAFKDGVATKALLGFLKSNNLDENDYKVVNTEKGEYIQITKFEKESSSKDILAEIIKEAVLKLEFEKSMKWGSSSFRFVRPIKWILALVDNKVLDIEISNVKSSNLTRGLRVFASQEIVIDDIDSYEKILLDNYVVANRDKRQEMILNNLPENTEVDKALLEEVTDLVEYPHIIIGEFNKKYLDLPEDLITITMKTHQRYFPIRLENKKLSNKFVVVRNAPTYSEQVKKGNEKVIEPRLSDSKFFFDEDLKLDLDKCVDKLKEVMFQKDMGTIYEKMLRSKKIASKLNADENILRAIHLMKFDLVSNVINEKEFTSLQGMMGSIYAEHKGENEIVSKAIFEHYMPRFQADSLPSNYESSIVAISDKLDTAMGAFCVGLKPTSSKDPYAIKRAMQGIAYIALNIKLDKSYIDLSEIAYDIFSEDKKVLYPKAKEEFIAFFKSRIEASLAEKYSRDLISYVINIETNFKNMVEKLDKLEILSKTSDFSDLVNLLKRMKNMVKENDSKELNISLIEDINEKNMLELIEKLNKKEDFSNTVDILVENKNVINDFFDNVMINTDDEKITNNRYAILNNILEDIKGIIEI